MLQNKKYIPIVNEQDIEIGRGKTVIVTGWTDPQFVKVPERLYAAKGSLRSCHVGIDNLIRNLLANSFVKGLVLYDRNPYNNAPDGNPLRAIANLISYGVEDFEANKRIPIKGGVGTISKQFSPKAIASLRTLTWIKETSLDLISGACIFINQTEATPRSPFLFYPPKIDSTKLPPTIGATIKGGDFSNCWLQVLNLIRKGGTIRPVSNNNGYWQEVLDLTVVVGTQEEPYPDYFPASPESLAQYLPQLLESAPPDDVRYTYGSRIRSWFGVNQIDQVVNKLVADPNSASSVCSLWDVNDHNKGGSPCLNHLWFRLVDNQLTLTALFRSNDMFNAWPLNALGLRELQKEVLGKLTNKLRALSHHPENNQDIVIGNLITISESAHIYSHSWEYADLLISDREIGDYDPAGNFLVTKKDKKVAIDLMNKQESIVKTLSGSIGYVSKNALKEFPQITANHAFYLGYELGRLEGVKNNEYKQR